ncbi:MAG TPA: iron-containing redox enzyme family protein [Thermoanaerobaculia bacterium]
MEPRAEEQDRPLRRDLAVIADKHLPSRHAFFRSLAECSKERLSDPQLLGELLHRYQAAMHATRAMAYSLPSLDSPELRKRKLRILVDDDGLPGGDTHHYQLRRAFIGMGAKPKMDDDCYDDLSTLQTLVDGNTASFIAAVGRLYSSSLGAWAIVELLSEDWMHALADALSVHFPDVVNEPYFAECFREGVEERHGLEALELLELICARRPEYTEPTLRDANEMAGQLTRLWDGLHDLIREA